MPALAHSALGMIIKRYTPQIPLWAILLSVNLIDIIYFILFFSNIIEVYWSHGLFMVIVWSTIAMLITFSIAKYFNSRRNHNQKKRSTKIIFKISVIIGFLVFSHWILDLIGWSMTGNGIPLLFNDSQKIKLEFLNFGEYNLLISAIVIEIGPFIIGLAIYIHYLIRQKKTKNKLLKESTLYSNQTEIESYL
ncbi:MAG: hypothetical protein ACFE9Z_14915 [Promethearchaeota archaeon]